MDKSLEPKVLGAGIRWKIHKTEKVWAVMDIIEVLTESKDPRKYWNKMKQRLKEEGSEVVTKCHQLKEMAADGKNYRIDFINEEGALRIIQSIPSPKAEPLKQWIAKVAHERIEEEKDPSLSIKRGIHNYKKQGRDDTWIQMRIEGIATRKELTDEWQERGIKGMQFGALTNEISKQTFGKDTSDLKLERGLRKSDNLRNNMSAIELTLQKLAEQATKEITIRRDAQGFRENFDCAHDGGTVAGIARLTLQDKLST